MARSPESGKRVALCYPEAVLNMKKLNRLTALFLVLFLVLGLIPAAGADVVTLGVYLSGRKQAENGTEVNVRLDGKFRVLLNGEDAGVIEAGKTTVTLPSTERIRLVPLAESIDPEWDLSTAYCEVQAEGGGTVTVPVIVYPLDSEKAQQEPVNTEEAPEPEPAQETPAPEDPETEGTESGEPAADDTGDDEDSAPVISGAVTTPTLPPFDASVLAPTPEPAWQTLPAGTGAVRVFAYNDQNKDGLASEAENAVGGVIVCLLTDAEKPVAAVTTGDDGIAVFENLPEGKYRIRAILPDGWAFSKKAGEKQDYASLFASSINGEETSDAFTVKEGAYATPGIGLSRCLHVSGVCWFDTNGDGLMSDDEPRLPGIQIEMNGEKNGLHYETVSDENGAWRIDRVNPAFYKLTVYAPDGMMFTRASKKNGKRSIITRDGTGKGSRQLDLNDKESKDNQYLGFAWAGQIKGRCFLDANYNGVYDEGELPMPGVKVTAIKQNKDEEIAVTYSGEDGFFTLTGLRGNTYKMRAVLPDDGSDFTRTVSDPLGNHFKSRPGRRENFWPDFVLADAEQREMNVGVIYPGSVTGTVYMDNDFSGSKTGKEKVISGFQVTLKDETGAVVATDKTSVKGKFELVKLPPGNYTLSVTAMKGLAFTKLGEGNVILNKTNGEGYSEPFFLALGENRTGIDIGMIQPGTVEGTVFADLNDNGRQDEGEQGLPGVVVRLMSEEGEQFRAEIGTDGKYLFDAVMPGEYYLEYTLPEKAVFAQVTDGGNTISGEGGTGRSGSFSLATGGRVEGPRCGALTLGRIEGYAFQDHDGDGIPGEGEETMDGMTITLTPSRGDLQEITAVTGEDGVFALENLHPDTYTLTVTAPEGHVVSRTDSITLPLKAGKDTQSVELPVAMGQEWTEQKLGAVMPASLSGQFWLDENNNGRFDPGEQTPAGYEITVTDDQTGKVFDVLRTDEEGKFATAGMIPGTFTLTFPLDENTISAPPGDSVFEQEGGYLTVRSIPLMENERKEGLMLGIVRYTSIGGSVWIDRGDSVETLAGAEIVLKDEDGETVQTQTTGENGAYRFDKLMPGTFLIEASMPEGCVIIEPGDPRLKGGQISVITEAVNRTGSSDPIELKMADDQLQMNIGCVLPGRLGDFCWLDLDGDGLQGMDEPGIAGVRIELVRNGETVTETVTDQYGFYRFDDIYPAAYTLRVTAPEEVKPTVRRTDIRLIASILEETEDDSCESVEIQVESDKANYNADLGFVCRREGELPPGIGEGKKQDWTKFSETD